MWVRISSLIKEYLSGRLSNDLVACAPDLDMYMYILACACAFSTAYISPPLLFYKISSYIKLF